MNKENKYCVYLHRRKDNNEIFYIGQGASNRPSIVTRKLKAWNTVVKEAGGFTFEILKDCLSKSEALDLEFFYITKHKDTIVNLMTSSSITKEMLFEYFNNLFYLDSESPTGLRYKQDVFAHVKEDKSYSIIHKAGDVAGNLHVSNSWCLSIKGRNYRVHRIVYLLHFGYISSSSEMVIDHIDGDSSNNQISNLREVSTAINRRNLKVDKRSTTNTTGVSRNINGTFKAYVSTLDGKRIARCYSISKYGEAEAFRLACEWRKEQIRLLNEQGAGYTERHGT